MLLSFFFFNFSFLDKTCKHNKKPRILKRKGSMLTRGVLIYRTYAEIFLIGKQTKYASVDDHD